MVTETQKPILRIEVTARTMVTAVVVAGCAWVTIRLAPVLLVLVVALVLVGTLNPAVEWLEARRFKRGTSIATVFGALFTGFAGIVALTVPALVAQVSEFVSAAPAARTRLIEALEQSQYTAPLSHSIQTMDYGDLAKSVAQRALDISGRSAEIVAYLASAIFLALYMMLDRDRLRGGLYSLVPRTHHIRLSRVLVSLEVIVGGYVRGQFITSALMSLFTFILLVACGVKGALAVALVAGMADVLPYLGVFISVGFALAASASKGWLVVLIVLALMLAYEELESRVLVPRIYGRVLKLPSSVVLFSLLTGGTLMGIPGALLALPLAAAIRMVIQELRVELPGEDVDDTAEREDDARAEREYEARAAGVPAEAAAAIAVAISEEQVGDKAEEPAKAPPEDDDPT